jgi:signal transduction histidine kinase/tetratricopeptide (TPR) repeat protein
MHQLSSLILLVILCLNLSCDTHKSFSDDQISLADSVLERATSLMLGPSPARSIVYLDSAFNSLELVGPGDLWKKYDVMANYYTYHEPNIAKRRVYIDSMSTTLKDNQTRYPYEYAHTLFSMAGLLQEERKYNQAFSTYYKGRNVAIENQDYCSMSEFSSALGLVRYKQEQYSKAIPYLKQALDEVQACSSSAFLHSFVQPQSILNSIGLCYERSGNLDSAAFYYKKALQFIVGGEKIYPHKRDYIITARAVVEGNLGGNYAKMGDFEEAEKHLLANISDNDRPGFAIEDAQTAKIKLGRLYINHGKLEKVKVLLDELESDLVTERGKSNAHAEIWEQWYELKWKYFDKTGNVSDAYKYSTRFHAYRDSLENVLEGLKNIDMDQVLNEQERKHELSMLKKSSELKNVYLFGLSVFLLMAMVVAAVIWLYYHRSRLNVQKLTVLNDQLQETLTALEISQNENSRLMKVVAHDLRNPVGAMVSLADLMIMDEGRPADDLQCLNLIKDSGKNSLELIGNLLYLNATVEEALIKTDVNLAELIVQCTDLMKVRAGQKQQRIRLSLEPLMLKLNYGKMWRVVNNLIHNSIKFSPRETVIDIGLRSDNGFAALTVKDQGIGIPVDIGNKIFDVFTDAKRKGTWGEESFGLGLSIAKQIVEAHGGQITFESVEGQGTTFTIRIPLTSAV